MSSKRNAGLTRRASGLMALEPRYMFDGAAVDTAVDALAHPDVTVVDAHPLFDAHAISNAALAQTLQQVQTQVRNVAAQWTDAQWMEVFGIQANDAQAVSALHGVQQQILDGSFQVQVVQLGSAQMGLSMAAFAANGPDGKPTVFINSDWWSGAEQDPRLVQALIEEVGHSIDAALHPQQDTSGDEGQMFAVRALGLAVSAEEVTRITSENDAGQLAYNGEVFQVEHASFNFTTAYKLAPEYRYYAEKEQESDRFLGQSLGVASIQDNTGLGTFSGNDVVVDLTIAGTTYHGWISRPIKDQGVVRGFYFWYDPQFATFTDASNDGNQDGDSNAVDNQGFVLVVDQSWFNAITAAAPVHDNANPNLKVFEVGSSSDRVDSALNSVLPVNVAPVANTDTSNITLTAGASGGPALEAGGLSNATAGANAVGNVLTNDTDSNSDTLKVTNVGLSTASSSVTASTTSANGTAITGLYGTLTLGSDGSYQYVVNDSNAAVQALRLSTNTLTDSFTYSIADPAGLAASARINIVIQGANDTPVAADDYNTAKESITSALPNNTANYDATDPLGVTATGNVLNNDTDVDRNVETKAIAGITATGTTGTLTAGTASTQLTFTAASTLSPVGVGDYVYVKVSGTNYQLYDANGVAITVTSKSLVAGTTTSYNIGLSATPAKRYPTSGSTLVSISSVNDLDGVAGADTVAFSGKNVTKNPSGTKEATVGSTTSLSSASVTLTTFQGTVAAGMGVTWTGYTGDPVTVKSVTYDTSGNPISVTLSTTTTLTTANLPNGTTLTFTSSAGDTLVGQYGNLQLNADGSYTYTPTADNANLAQGETKVDAFTYTMQDAGGLTSKATLYITVQGSGTNDPNAVADTATPVEAGGVNNGTAGTNPSGNLLTNDTTPTGTKVVYSAASSSSSAATAVATNTQITGLYGTLTLSTTGAYTYTVDNSNVTVQALHGTSNTLTEVFRYTIRNGVQVSSTYLSDTSTVTFTIQGSNDNPVASNDSATAVEAGGYLNGTPGYNPSGNVLSNDTDVDDAASALRVTAVRTGGTEGSGTAGTVGVALAGLYGSLTLSADGSWTYTVNNSNATVNALASGQTLTDSFNYTVMDSSGTTGLTDIAVLAVTIQGATDTLAVNNVFVNEASPYAVFTVSGANGMSVLLALGNTVGAGALNTKDRLATLGTDTPATSTLEYFNGSTWQTYDASNPPTISSSNQLLVRIGVTQDTTHEGNESFTLTATSGSQTAVGIGTINDEGEGDLYPDNTTGAKDTTSAKDDDRPLISIGDSTVSEGGNLVFTASLSNASAYPISFTPTLTGLTGSATLGTDTAATSTLEVSYNGGSTWSTVSGAVTFAAGQTSMQFRLATVDDTSPESAENLYLSTSYINGVVKNQTDVNGEGIIIDNDGTPTYAISDESVNEGAGTITFTVTRSGDASATGSVSYSVATGTATTADYSGALTGTVTFAPTVTSQTIVLNVTPDGVYEGSEQFYVNLSNPSSGSAIADNQGVGTITDDGTGNGGADDDRPVLTVTGVDDVSEGSYSVFTVTLDKPLAANTDIKLQLADGTAVLSSDLNSTTMQVITSLSTALGAGTSVSNGGNFTLAAGTQTFYVRVLTKGDSPAVYEGAENFSLTASFVPAALLYADRTGTVATVRTGASANDTSTILDDGSGKVYDGQGGYSGTPDDDRAVTVNSIWVNEASPWAVFTVSGAANQKVTLSLSNGTALGGTTAPTDGSVDYNTSLQYFNGSTWAAYTANAQVSLDGNGQLLVRNAVVNDTPYEGAQTYTLSASNTGGTAATGTATILDDGTGNIYPDNTTGNPDPDALKNDDRPVQVNNILVNEASPWAVFRVNGTAGQSVTLALQNDSDSNTVNATLGIDTGTQLQYFDGSAWVNYTGAVTLPSGGELLVRVAIVNDTPYEGPENFQLLVTPSGGTAVVGNATILDDGTGNIYPDNPTGNPDPDAVKNDDRPVQVNNILVNEASPWAVFRVDGTAGQSVTLALQNDNDPSTANAKLGTDTGTQLQYFDGNYWVNYSTSVTLPSGGELLVRVAIVNDTPYEGPENFQLLVTPNGGTAVVGNATILDDGTGNIYPDNPTGNPDPDAVKNDDRPVQVNNILVNEASPWAVFRVNGTAGQSITLALQNDNDPSTANAALGTDTGTQLQYFNGSTWVNYSGAVTLPTGGELLVRVAIVNDTPYEGPENFQLRVTPNGGATVYGNATILDDGTGNIYPDNPTGNPDPDAVKNDDRPVQVNNILVNEASPWAVFRVDGTAGQSVTLALQNDNDPSTANAKLGTDTGTQLQYFDGSAWVNYTGAVTLPGGGELLVRVAIVNDTPYEGPENFQLAVTPSGGNAVYGNATILDDGTGDIYPDNNTGSTDPSATKNDDRPVQVNNIEVNEASPWAVFRVNGTAGQSVTLALQNDNDPSTANAKLGTDTGTQLQYFDGSAWVNYTGAVTLPGGGELLVRVAIVNDTPYEGPENFQLAVTPSGGNAVYGNATILDDGTGDIYPDNNTGSTDPSATKNDDRAISVTGYGPVNEGSQYAMFTVTATPGQMLDLSLQPATSGSAATRTGFTLQYSLDGTTWITYDANHKPTAPTNGKVYVRVDISSESDANYEGAETFALKANFTNVPGIQAAADTSIVDDGTGTKYGPNVDPTTGPATDTTNLDNDQSGPITVTGGSYNENSPRAVFTINANAGQVLTLDVQNAAQAGKAPTGDNEGKPSDSLDNAPIYYSLDGGATWNLYTGPITAGNVPVLVAVDITNERDDVYEGEEQLKLVVTSGGQSASAYSSIFDDGTGTVTHNITDQTRNDTGTNDASVIKNDDRPMSVSNVTVNEGSPYAVFTVSGAAGQKATLSLNNGTTSGLVSLQYFDGTSWQPYTPGNLVTLDSNGKLLVRVALSPEQEAELDTGETFKLVATNTGGAASTGGNGTIMDDGTGDYFAENNNSATPSVPAGVTLDDDRPKAAPPQVVLPPVTPPAPPAPLAPPAPVVAAPQAFASTLQPLAPRSAMSFDPSLALVDVKTSSTGYQIPVSETAPPGLTVNRGVTDQVVESTQSATKISLPFDAFMHSNKDAIIQLSAKQANDAPLPKWVQFDPATGVFEVTPPKGFKGKLDLKVIARDDDGREAVAMFQMFIGEQTVNKPQSRFSFSEKLRMAGKRPVTLVRVAEAGPHKLHTAEARVTKVRAG